MGLAPALLPGLLLLPVPAWAAPPVRPPKPVAPPVSSPPLQPPAPSIPTAEGALSVPADWNSPLSHRAKRDKARLPALGRELVDRRDAVSKVFDNGDGTETVKIHLEDVHYRPHGQMTWQPIDNTIVADDRRPGWLRNAANGWTVWFGPIKPGGRGGVELVTDAGTARFVPELAATAKVIEPVVGEGDSANTVTYRGVWSGVDVRYVVTGGRVHTEILSTRTGQSHYPFLVDGLGLSSTKDAVAVAGKLAKDVRVDTAQVIAGATSATTHLTSAAGRQRMTISVDGASAQSVVTTSAAIGPSKACGYGLSAGEVWCGGVRTGTNRYPPAQHWWLRGVAQFNYRPHVEQKDVLYAGVWMSQSAGSTANPELVNIWEATDWSSHGAVAGGNSAHWIDSAVVTNNNGCFGADVCFDVTDKMHQWQLAGAFNGWWDGKFGFSPEEDDYPGFLERFSYKYFAAADIALVMNLNTRPPAPVLVGPRDGALAIDTLTPTLKWNAVTDADGDPVKYTAKIATGVDGESGLVATSPEQTGLQWTIPPGVLQDGLTYYWKVFVNDTKAWVPSIVHKLTVDRRLGSGGVSPVDEFSGVSTNLVSGNTSISIDGPDLTTVAGGIDVDLVYNGRPALTGLTGTYREDKDKDHVVDPEDPVKLVRNDARISFAWGTASPSPAVPADYFLATWSGTIRTPPGNWQLGVRADDGSRIWIDGVKVVDRWSALTPDPVYQTGTVNGLRKIQFDYFEHTSPAYVELWARNAANPSQAFVVPADWLSPEAPHMPAGWSVAAADAEAEYARATVSEGSISLTEADGSAVTFTKQPNGGFKAPEGTDDVVNIGSDGSISVHDAAGMSYVFRPDGGLESAVSALDDRRPAAARNYYDGLGRLSRVNDPVSGRDVTFRYAAADGDTACPNVPPLGSALDYESEAGLLCRISYWDGTSTDLYYHRNTDLLSHIAEPGDLWWGFSYDSQGRLTAIADPLARDALFSGDRTDSDLTRLFTQIEYLGDSMASRVRTVTAPAAMQTDTQRPQQTYSYSQNTDGGILIDGISSIARAGVSGYTTVKYDHRGRETERTDVLGRTDKTHWDHRDLVVATESADGLLTATIHNNRSQPTDVWGPAPAAWFDKVWYVSDYYFPKPDKASLIPHDVTRYDEGIDGLDVRWWNNIGRSGPVAAHQHNAGAVREGFPAGSIPEGINADDVSARFTGDIVFGPAGEYQLQICAGANDLASLSIDSIKLVDVWAVPSAKCGSPAQKFRTWGANATHRIQIDFVDLSGDAMLHLNWTKPNGTYEPVPASALKPGYGLITSTTDEGGRTTRKEYTETAAGIGPQHGLTTRTITDPSGLNLSETATYEPAGGTGRFLRPLTRTLPSGPGSAITSTYYGNSEQRDNPCTTAVDPSNQGGMLKLDTAADPDGTGPATPVVREVVYDKAGRAVATRSGSGLLTDPDWTCTTYDARGRETEIRYPAYGGEPARTVTFNYRADPDGAGPRAASPMVTSTTDSAGTIIAEGDLLGREISYRDVFGNTTTSSYDLAGREISSNGPAGHIVTTYDSLDRVTSLSRNGSLLANGITYDAADRLTSVAYPSGTGAAGNNTKGTFEHDPTTGHRKKVTWTGPGGALLTSDEVNARSLAGQVLGQIVDGVEHHVGNDYSYDAAGRLIEAWVPGARYDFQYAASPSCAAPNAYKNANRSGMTVTPNGQGAIQTGYCYDHADRLVSVTDPVVGAITYDAHGNTSGVFGETHQYDVRDRHIGTVKGNLTIRYVRDATDRIVERSVSGVPVARYGSSGSGDTADFTTDTNNNVLEVTLSLPGGALLTTRSAGNVWSYPDSHGNVAATANQAGAKQGITRIYDPFGGLVSGGVPDNAHGDFDYGWLGQHQRPLEHQPGLQPIIEMGARQYSPLLGRFLEVDPVEGGSANDYDYCGSDPVNCSDVDGSWGMPKWAKKAFKKTKKWAKKEWKKTKKWAKKKWKKFRKWTGKKVGKLARSAGRLAGKHLRGISKWGPRIGKWGGRIGRGFAMVTTWKFAFTGCLIYRSVRDKDDSFRDSVRDIGGCAKTATGF